MHKVAAKIRRVDTVKCVKRNIIIIYCRHFGTMLTFGHIITVRLTPPADEQMKRINDRMFPVVNYEKSCHE